MSDAPAPEHPPETAPSVAGPAPQPRAVTLKAILLGLIGVLIVAGYSDFNDSVVRSGPPVAGNQLPIVPLALTLLVAAGWNPLMGRLWRGFRFSARELAVALIVMLVSVWLPGYGLYRSFTVQLIRPWTHEIQHPEWQKHHTLAHIPKQLVPLGHDDANPRYEVVYREYETGITTYNNKSPPLSAIPWREWLAVMPYWGPLIMLIAVALGALAVLVHRQWSHHEQLPYPLASVYAALLPGEGGRIPEVMRSRLFWFGTIPPLIFFGDQWLCRVLQGHFPWIWFGFWFNADIYSVFPTLGKVGWNGVGWVHCTGVGLAYFVASEIGFTISVTYMVFGLIACQYYMATGDVMSGPDKQDTTGGAIIGYGAVLLYAGRTYYLAALVRAFRRLREGEDPVAPWAARILLLASAGMAWLLTTFFGFDWFIACVYVLTFLLFFLVVTRVICETGIPFFQAEMDISLILTSVLGFPVIGPGSLVMIYWLGSILNFDTRVTFMPFAANSLRLAEHARVRLPSLVPVAVIAIALAILIGFAAQVWKTYTVGGKRDDYHVLVALTDSKIGEATTGLAALEDTGRLEASASTSGPAKLGLITDNRGHGRHLGWMGFGLSGVILLFLVRFRWPGFLLHPIVFVLWATWPAQVLWFPFMVGWLAKTAIVKYGGGRAYHAAKPFFLGMIIGEIVLAAFFIVANLIIYLVSGQTPGSGYFGG